MDAKVTWNGAMAFTGSSVRGFALPLDAAADIGGSGNGFTPLELLLIGLAGCTGMDVILILRKKKQQVISFEVRIHADQQLDSHPHVFTAIQIEFVIVGQAVDPTAVARAIELSRTRYCPANAMLGQVVPITFSQTVIEAPAE